MSRLGLPSSETSSGGELASEAQLAGGRVGQGTGSRRQGGATGLALAPRRPELSDYQEAHLATTHSPGLLQALPPQVLLQEATLIRRCHSGMTLSLPSSTSEMQILLGLFAFTREYPSS